MTAYSRLMSRILVNSSNFAVTLLSCTPRSLNYFSLGTRRSLQSSTSTSAKASTMADGPAPLVMEQIGSNKQFGGWNKRFKHRSSVLGCDMNFTIYFPPAAEKTKVGPEYGSS